MYIVAALITSTSAWRAMVDTGYIAEGRRLAAVVESPLLPPPPNCANCGVAPAPDADEAAAAAAAADALSQWPPVRASLFAAAQPARGGGL
jgi:hypothetical protein